MSSEYSPSDIDILAEIEKDLKNRKAVTFDPLSAIPPYSLYYLPRTQFEEFSAGLQREGLIDVAQAKKLADKYNELMKSKALTEELCTGFDDQRGHSAQTQAEYEFGRSMRSHFSLDEQRVFLNHGSFGATPNVVRRTMKNFQDEMENNCDRWFVVRTRELYDETRKVVAPLIHANHYDDIALVDNASAGVNSVLRSLPLLLLQEKEKKLEEKVEEKEVKNMGDGEIVLEEQRETTAATTDTSLSYILYFNIAYGMVKQTLFYLRDCFPHVRLVEVVLETDDVQNHDAIMSKVERFLDENRHLNIELAVFDHISSKPALVFPVARLGALFKSRGILSLVDGAHAIGQVPINVQEMNVDYYLTNLHKWLFCPKSCAILWIRPELRSSVRPTIISFGYETKCFKEEFLWTGTRDHTPAFSSVRAVEWRREIGGEDKIMNYCRQLASFAGRYLSEVWQTRTLVLGETNQAQMNSAMVNVQLPCNDKETLDAVFKILWDKHNFFCHMLEFDGRFFVRVSCQIYNDEADIRYMGQLVLDVLGELQTSPPSEKNENEQQ